MKNVTNTNQLTEGHLKALRQKIKDLPDTPARTYSCDKCQDTGVVIIVRESGLEAARRCACKEVDPVDASLQYHYKTELAAVYSNKRIADFDTDIYRSSDKITAEKLKRLGINFVKKYQQIRQHKPDLYFYSETPGSGKTMLSCLIAKGLSNVHKLKSQAISTPDVLRKCRSSFDSTEVNEEDILNRLKSVDVLVLDEIGGEKHSEYSEEVLTTIINHRMNTRRTTIYTSNYSVDELPYHDRLKDRIVSQAVRAVFPEYSVRATIGQADAEIVNKMLMEN